MHRNRHYIWWWSQFAAARAAQLVHSADITACTRCTAVPCECCRGYLKSTLHSTAGCTFCIVWPLIMCLLSSNYPNLQVRHLQPGQCSPCPESRSVGAWSHNAVTEPRACAHQIKLTELQVLILTRYLPPHSLCAGDLCDQSSSRRLGVSVECGPGLSRAPPS